MTKILITPEWHLYFVFSGSDSVYFTSIRFVPRDRWCRNTIRKTLQSHCLTNPVITVTRLAGKIWSCDQNGVGMTVCHCITQHARLMLLWEQKFNNKFYKNWKNLHFLILTFLSACLFFSQWFAVNSPPQQTCHHKTHHQWRLKRCV